MIKVAFIVCYKHTAYMRECMDYISWLNVPKGVETEIIGITDAESLAAGYNAAMNSTDAKYKVYLHQDVFIFNKNFIQDIITIFENHVEYGMIGVIGSNRIVPDALYWINWNIGKTFAWDALITGVVSLNEVKGSVESVKAIDGLIMITQYDIPWREDIFDGFDFYDIAQSQEFLQAGYKVGVVNQIYPWCHHDCGVSKLSTYDFYRKRFCETYKEAGYVYEANDQLIHRNKRNLEMERIMPEIEKEFQSENFELIYSVLDALIQYCPYDTKLFNICAIVEVILEERVNKVEHGFYKKGMTLDDLLEKYTLYRFFLKRLEYDYPIETLQDVLELIAAGDGRFVAERVIAGHTVYKKEIVIHKLKMLRETQIGGFL